MSKVTVFQAICYQNLASQNCQSKRQKVVSWKSFWYLQSSPGASATRQQVRLFRNHIFCQLAVPKMEILSVMTEAPRLLDFLAGEPVQASASTCTVLRIWFRQRVTTVTLPTAGSTAVLQPDHWPNLVLAIVPIPTAVHNCSRDWFGPLRENWKRHMTLTALNTQNSAHTVLCKPKFRSLSPLALQPSSHAVQRFAQQHGSTATHFKLQSSWIDAKTVQDLTSHSWPALTFVDLVGQVDDDAMLHAANGSWGHCKTLRVHGRLKQKGVCYLKAGSLSNLRQLSLFELDKAGVKAVTTGSWPNLTRLDLSYATPDRLGFESLSCAPWKHLKTVVLVCVRIDVADATHLILADWPVLQNLAVTYKYAQEAAYDVLGVQDVRYELDRLETQIMLYQRDGTYYFPRRSNTAWPELKQLTVTIESPDYKDMLWSEING